jgi:hypothetical protein
MLRCAWFLNDNDNNYNHRQSCRGDVLMRTKLCAVLGVCAAALALFGAAHAQDAPELSSVLTVEVKPGTNGQFEEFVTKFRDAAEETNSSLRWRAVSAESGSDAYVFTRPFGSFAALEDAGPDLTEVYGAEEAQRLLGLLAASAASMSTTIYADRPDLSRPWPALEGTPAAVLYIDLNVRVGMEAAFEDYVHKVVEATDATAPEAFWLMRQRVFGPGTANGAYRVAVVFPEWSDLDAQEKPIPQRMREHFGAEEGDRLEATVPEFLVNIRETLHRVRTDLAREPE